MANNHQQFLDFHDAIKATKTRRKTLKKNRDALREKVRKYFKKEHSDYAQPKFYWQGSYAMYTLLNPIKDEDGLGAYDLDDGIYFECDSEEDRQTINWYHEEVYAAVCDHTDNGAEDIDPCIRVHYADGHHIDLAIYFMVKDSDKTELAHRKEPWHESNPDEMLAWFTSECKEKSHLRELVRFLKAWCEYKKSTGTRMPSGCIISMLAAEHYVWNDEGRYDIAMRDILKSMHEALSADDGFHCYRPVSPEEDLFENYSDSRKKAFLNELKSFADDAERAINNTNQKDGCLKWQKHLGERFSCSTAKDKDEDAQTKDNSGSIVSNSRFA